MSIHVKKSGCFLIKCLALSPGDAGAVPNMDHSNHLQSKTNDGSNYDFEGLFKLYSWQTFENNQILV